MGVKGDFKGFTFNNVHTSTLGLIRVSSSNRYTDNLGAVGKDTIVDRPNNDGAYFFSSIKSRKTFTVNCAFKDMPEQQYQDLKDFYNTKVLAPLVFDENPYQIYMAKITGSMQMKIVPFLHNNQRTYSGEITLEFTCYFAYAVSRFSDLKSYSPMNIDTWADEYGEHGYIINTTEDINSSIFVDDNDYHIIADKLHPSIHAHSEITVNELLISVDDYIGADNNLSEWILTSDIPLVENRFVIYNPGDEDAFWHLFIENVDGALPQFSVMAQDQLLCTVAPITLKSSTYQYHDVYLELDSRTSLLYGCDANRQHTGTVYNKFITNNIKQLSKGLTTISINGLDNYKYYLNYQYLYL